MKITPCRKRGSIGLAILVLLVVTVTLIGLATVIAKCSRLKPRTFETEGKTNSFFHYYRPDIVIAALPEDAMPPIPMPPPGLVSLVHETMAFTGEIAFAESDVVGEGFFSMMRSTNLTDWTIVLNVIYWEPVSTNGFITNKFADLTAPIGTKFYKGVLLDE